MVRQVGYNNNGGKKMKNNLKLVNNPRIQKYIEDSGVEDVNKLFELALEEYIDKEDVMRENEVEKWVRILGDLVDWANEGKNIEEVSNDGYRDNS